MDFLDRYKQSETTIRRETKIAAARASFRAFCNLTDPVFCRSEREYQEILCDTMQRMYEKTLINPETRKPYDILIINLPPGFGKSRMSELFAVWAFGQNPQNIVLTVSYGQKLAIDFAKAVRDMIQEESDPRDPEIYTAANVFPALKIKQGDGAMDKWALENSYMSYLGTSFNGKLTGMRGNVLIIDDPIKSAEEAVNESVKDKHWNFYKNTAMSRLLPHALQIIVHTRWATDDLSGRIESAFGERCVTIKMCALNEKDESLCEGVYPAVDLIQKRNILDNDIWSANYLQIPIDIKGVLYGEFKRYDVIDTDKFERTIAYIDTADEGADYLCVVIGGVMSGSDGRKCGYITNIYYTDLPMEVTERETARILNEANVRDCLIESNNGGRGFARNVIAALRKMNNHRCNVTWFHQSKNKNTRILVNATNVMEQLIMPEDWRRKWPEFAKAVAAYQRKGKNAHDDAPDALTGFTEFINGDVKGLSRAKVGKRKWFGI